MNSYIAEKIEDGTATLGREDSRHAVMVMRLKAGDDMLVTDGAGRRFEATALICQADGVTARITLELPANESETSVTVLIGSLKSDKLEFLTQKLTELGVSRVIPVKMARCVALNDAAKKTERLEKIAREAVKQSKRSVIPEVGGLTTWKRALEIIAASETALMPWEEAEKTRVKDVYKKSPADRNISILIGPEGGITREEAEAAQKAGAVQVTLGPRILRAETAAIVAASLVQSLWGDV